MEAFQILSRGGVRFDKHKYKNDVQLFNVRSRSRFSLNCLPVSPSSQTSKVSDNGIKASVRSQEGELPTELDFFKYAQNGSGKRKATTPGKLESKKRKVDFAKGDEEKAGMGEEEDNGHSQALAPKHRVITKGSNVPECLDTFPALKDRYQIPSQLMTNLSQNGYVQPTAIQSYGIPILLEVGRTLCVNA